jgi:hypothetical protein
MGYWINKLTRDQEKFLLGLLNSSAAAKYQQRLMLELTFADACKYWGVNENLRGEAVDTQLSKLHTGLTDVVHVLGGKDVELSDGRSLSNEDVRLLRQVDDYLMERFSRHLTLLRNRSDPVA